MGGAPLKQIYLQANSEEREYLLHVGWIPSRDRQRAKAVVTFVALLMGLGPMAGVLVRDFVSLAFTFIFGLRFLGPSDCLVPIDMRCVFICRF